MSDQLQLALPKATGKPLFCMECGNYLSVGPIMVSPNGDLVCGRCPKPKNSTEYSYDVTGKESFRCVNHHAGCRQRLCFKDNVKEHEETCEFKEEFDCPSCEFVGNGCQLLCHFGKMHVNSIVKGATLRQILSYHELENYINFIERLNADDLKLFICTVAKMFSFCSVCNRISKKGNKVFLCPKYHLACATCATKLCHKCEVVIWDSDTELHRKFLRCDWPDCVERANIFNYLFHKRDCEFRQYKCPKKNCHFVGLLSMLKKHWHLNDLMLGPKISLSEKSVCYWLTPLNDILFISNIKENYGSTISVSNVDVISNIYITFCVEADFDHEYRDWKQKATEPVKFLSGIQHFCSFTTISVTCH